MKLDHLAIACETLEEGRAFAERALGVALQPGGKHDHFGTHNMLLGLQDGIYLEVIAIDPDAPDPGRRRWFDLDDFHGPPRLTHWICQTGDMAATLRAAPGGMGAVDDLRRGDLCWQMASGEGGRLPFDAAFPALIAWGDSPHPSTRLPSSGLRLQELTVLHPQAAALQAALTPLLQDMRIRVEPAAKPGLKAQFADASGALRCL
ncbi:MAG: polyphosphate kinase [Rhodobacterales bacterium]|nr:MAG: polyphosphate kinase [Rhodobacterales bacterium]